MLDIIKSIRARTQGLRNPWSRTCTHFNDSDQNIIREERESYDSKRLFNMCEGHLSSEDAAWMINSQSIGLSCQGTWLVAGLLSGAWNQEKTYQNEPRISPKRNSKSKYPRIGLNRVYFPLEWSWNKAWIVRIDRIAILASIALKSALDADFNGTVEVGNQCRLSCEALSVKSALDADFAL